MGNEGYLNHVAGCNLFYKNERQKKISPVFCQLSLFLSLSRSHSHPLAIYPVNQPTHSHSQDVSEPWFYHLCIML